MIHSAIPQSQAAVKICFILVDFVKNVDVRTANMYEYSD